MFRSAGKYTSPVPTTNGSSQQYGSGRRAEAARNDDRILAAAADVLTAHPASSMSHIAARAQVGIGSLYRRFPSKEALIARLCLDTMRAITGVARQAFEAARDDPSWDHFVQYLSSAFDVGAGSLEVLAGSFPAGAELSAAAHDMNTAIAVLLDHFQTHGVVRRDVTANDLMQLPVMVRAVVVGDPVRTAALHRRYVQLFATAFDAAARGYLTEPPPTWQEIHARWE
jgi:AcrR family transcriptional regulator